MPSNALLQGISKLSFIDGLDILQEPFWNDKLKKWVIKCRFTVISGEAFPLPRMTDWYVLIDSVYPAGSIDIYPAKIRGITQTFPHQSRNTLIDPDSLWRSGKICVHSGNRALGRLGGSAEPLNASNRLSWYLERAIDWINSASRNLLNGNGDPFELPDFESSFDSILGFSENEISFELWTKQSNQAGFATFYSPTSKVNSSALTVVRSYESFNKREIYKPQWGKYFEPSSTSQVKIGVWVKLPVVPYLPPWQAPYTWGELKELLQPGINIHELLNQISVRLREQKTWILLCGFPIPKLIGEKPSEFFWQAAQFPQLTSPKESLRGFRNNEKSRRLFDNKRIFNPDFKVKWIRSENWHQTTRSIRGRFGDKFIGQHVLLIGCGALGSVIAEMLVRGGVERLIVCDGDIVLSGNLVRHTLLFTDIAEDKSAALAARLNLVSPHARVEALKEIFPPIQQSELDIVSQADLIIDCTGEDGTIYSLASFPWNKSRIFCSLSLDWQAERIFCYLSQETNFSAESFFDQIVPLLKDESSTSIRTELREGIGCWHPIMPARIDNIWLLAAAAVHYIDNSLHQQCFQSGLTIFECKNSPVFSGVCRVQ